MNQPTTQQLLESTQALFQIVHRHVVDEIVKRNGQFSPFGVGVSAEGEYRIAGIENSDPVQSLSFVIQALRAFAQQGQIVTAATCFARKVSTPQGCDLSDAIIIVLEDTTKTAINCCGTYRYGSSVWEFGDMTAERGDPIIFS